MEEFTRVLLNELSEHSDESNAKWMKSYMRDQFEFFGLRASDRKSVAKFFLAKENKPGPEKLEKVVKELWADPHREAQLVAMELINTYKKNYRAELFQLFEYMITTKSWWDTVDYIASNLVGVLIKKFPKEGYKTIEKWRKSGNMWLVRTCIIFQLKHKDEVDEELLYSLIRENMHDKEFFIRKAIGWSLRQYAKFNPQSVLDFVEDHELSGLSRREALKNIS